MNNATDQQLLREYVERRSEAAFTELARRHIDLVYSTALRMVRDTHLAEDVTQAAFAALAQNARQLATRSVLSGWLHRTAQHIAANVVRSDVRRRAREQEAAAMNELLSASTDASWDQIAPHLDAALSELDDAERDAVLLRYFEKKSAREMAEILGVSDEAAQKRVSRAVERLREFFSKRNVTIGASGLVILISANAVQSAPAALLATISAAVLAGTAISTSTAIAATKAIAMTTIQKTFIAATLAVVAGTGIYEAHQAAQLREQNQTLQQQQAPLAEQLRQLRRERDAATNQLAGLLADNAQLQSDSNQMELLKLRAEVTRLRGDSQALASLKADPTGANERVAKIKARLEQMPEKKIPELRFLTDQEWKMWTDRVLRKGETDEDYRYAFSFLRQRAKVLFVGWLGQALHNYAKANNGLLPTDLSQLKPYFTPPVYDANRKPGDPSRYELLPVDDAILQRYQLVQTGKLSEVPQVGTYPPLSVTGDAERDAQNAAEREKTKTNLPWTEPVVVEKAPVDDQFDSLFTVTVYGYSYRTFGRGTGGGSGTFAKAQVSTNGVPEMVEPVPAVGRRWIGGGSFGGGSSSGGGGSFGGGGRGD